MTIILLNDNLIKSVSEKGRSRKRSSFFCTLRPPRLGACERR
nr:MAG TPA: hypothetical protein [Microviridae sp.]DAP48422.1 MAG TPA: hypothetical protein [Microviridae sp.]